MKTCYWNESCIRFIFLNWPFAKSCKDLFLSLSDLICNVSSETSKCIFNIVLFYLKACFLIFTKQLKKKKLE